jgi:hypothetical protein
MHNKESINQNALMHARHRRGERSFGGPRTGPLFPSKEVKTSNGREKLFSDKSFNQHFVQRDGRDGLDWQLGDSLDGGGGCANGRVIQGWRLRELARTGEVSAAHPTVDSIEATERA